MYEVINGIRTFPRDISLNALLTERGIIGTAFYVNLAAGGGADTNSGLSPDDPLLTIKAAIDLCTDDKGDYVFVMDCYSEDTEPIVIDSPTCHVIGLSLPNSWGYTVLSGTGANDVFRIASNYIELAGFSIVAASLDAIHILSSGSPSYAWIHHNNFAVAALSLANAIEFDANVGSNNLIEDCHFGKLTTSITGYGITGGAVETTIRRNVFKNIATIAINLTSTITAGNIYDNLFAITDDVNGEAITLASGVSDCMVVNNTAVNGMLNAGYTFNPYRDLNTNTDNHWARNYRGNSIIEPVGV